MIKIASTLLLGMVFAVCFVSLGYLGNGHSNEDSVSLPIDNQASVFFSESVTAESLKLAYARSAKKASVVSRRGDQSEKLKILIVPGHDKDSWGTQFGDIKENDLTVALGQKIYDLLKSEPSLDVYLSQDKTGYSEIFKNYFSENKDSITEFMNKQRGVMEYFSRKGLVEKVVNVEHNFANSNTAIRLYGINKWANENGVDVVIHVHFNDYPGRARGQQGKYSGFAIYIPENQYSNHNGSRAVAESITNRLAKFYPQSNFPPEKEGLVEDQELIAIGANNTLDGAGLLVEYGYIYESPFSESILRDSVINDLAFQTYLGLMDFFDEEANEEKIPSTLLDFEFADDLERGTEPNPDVLNLQATLISKGFYPPVGFSRNDCPITGIFGPCTEKAVKAFQEAEGIEPASGFVGELTRARLNQAK